MNLMMTLLRTNLGAASEVLGFVCSAKCWNAFSEYWGAETGRGKIRQSNGGRGRKLEPGIF